MVSSALASDRRAADPSRAHADPLALGPVLVARRQPVGPTNRATVHRASMDGEFVAIYFPVGDAAKQTDFVYVVDSVAPPPAVATQDCIALLAPYRFVAGILPHERAAASLPRTIGLGVLQRYLADLLTLDRDHLCERQTALTAHAIQALLAAALLPSAAQQGLGSRRRVSLLDRVVAHIDANLRAPLSADVLCTALGCSRSALYRATARAGGAAELISTRRLTAIRTMLDDAAEQRPIARIAELHGFPDAAQFNRRFKAVFGAPPGEIRRRAGASHRRGYDRSCS